MKSQKIKPYILVIDDDYVSRLLISEILGEEEINIIEAGAGTEAIWMLTKLKDKINLVIVDIKLPDGDGFFLLMELRAIKSNIPALAISAIPPLELAMKSRIVGFNYWLSKPIGVYNLKSIVNEMFSCKEKVD